MQEQKLEDQVSAHERRNAALRDLFLEKKIDLKASRDIELHFWAWSPSNASAIAESLRRMNLQIKRQSPAGIQADPQRWNIEAVVRQSIDLTMRREFVTDLVDLARAHDGIFDGWGTSI